MRKDGDNIIVYETGDQCEDNSKICNTCIHSDNEQIRTDAYCLKFCLPDANVRREQIFCPHCHQQNFSFINFTTIEMLVIKQISTDPKFVFSMLQLKQNNIVEFNLKMAQFKQLIQQQNQQKLSQSNVPRCPTCGSTNIKKISGAKRYVSTGLFGLASSDLGHTQQCNDCGYKW